MPTYKTLRTDKRNHVMRLTTDKGTSLMLINYYSDISCTYAGYVVKAPIEVLRGFLKQYPDFLEQICEHEPHKWAEANGFKREELTKFETLTLNALY